MCHKKEILTSLLLVSVELCNKVCTVGWAVIVISGVEVVVLLLKLCDDVGAVVALPTDD